MAMVVSTSRNTSKSFFIIQLLMISSVQDDEPVLTCQTGLQYSSGDQVRDSVPASSPIDTSNPAFVSLLADKDCTPFSALGGPVPTDRWQRHRFTQAR